MSGGDGSARYVQPRTACEHEATPQCGQPCARPGGRSGPRFSDSVV